MKKTFCRFPVSVFITGLLVIFMASCSPKPVADESIIESNWVKRKAGPGHELATIVESFYLPVYSQIYSQSEHRTHDLTVTVSIRNTSETDMIYLSRADYFDTSGSLIKSYCESTVFLKPLETVAIVINEDDKMGGTGGNFLFKTKSNANVSTPVFEAVMISTSGQQGLSFTTRELQI